MSLPCDEERPSNIQRQNENFCSIHKSNIIGLGSLLICIVAFVLQTELAQFVQTGNMYNKPYFILWVVHSSWLIMLPIQFAFKPNLRKFIKEFLYSTHELFNMGSSHSLHSAFV
ncbi:hypothetical protein Glove_152g17 [Diversispora epigaea]|uniref:Uncharacterized protein n=1 Tax=Diversispora epigaea TaxID=1348612 RepID=A0A397ISQ4_9GLOM|nr:hypothetical protein Glove_152g17 [Diversispora epigaea]